MNRNIWKLAIIIGVFALFASVKSNAQNQPDNQKDRKPPSTEEVFKMMDADKDGQLTKAEVKGPLKNDFAKIDLDENGFITEEELEKAPKPKRQGPPRKKK